MSQIATYSFRPNETSSSCESATLACGLLDAHSNEAGNRRPLGGLPVKYNRPHATASWGTMAKDWEAGVDYARLRRERLGRARDAIRARGLGAVLCFNPDNIRYVTSTHIGEWARDKFDRYAICPADGEPFLWDP